MQETGEPDRDRAADASAPVLASNSHAGIKLASVPLATLTSTACDVDFPRRMLHPLLQ
jgi:hypothetical protein